MAYCLELAYFLAFILLANHCMGFYVRQDSDDDALASLSDFLEQQDPLAYDKRAEQELTAQKRYFCRKFFVYNPVRGRCQPTLLALRKGRSQFRHS